MGFQDACKKCIFYSRYICSVARTSSKKPWFYLTRPEFSHQIFFKLPNSPYRNTYCVLDYTANISAVKDTLFTCVLKAHVLPLYFLHQNNCKFYIRLNAIFYTGINAIFTRNKCNFYTWINVFTSMYIYSNVKITFIHV